MNSNSENNNVTDKPFHTVPGGEYDRFGFYNTPDGSFWDPDGVYFNKEGVDRHGGFYDENMEYHPGGGWIEDLMCYADEKEETLRNRPQTYQHFQHGDNYQPYQQHHKGRRGYNRNNDELDEAGDDLDDIDELYENVNFEKLMQEDVRNPMENNYNRNTHYAVNAFHTGNTGNTNTNIDKNISQPTKEDNNIPTELLFNKIPENKKQQIGIVDANNDTVRKEKQIEIDSLFQ